MNSTETRSIRFRNRYHLYLRNSFLAALTIHLLLFYFFPGFEIKPYVLPETVEFEVVVPERIEIPPPPAEVRQPQPEIVAAGAGASAADIDIAPNVFGSIDEIPLPRESPPEHSRNFYVFDKAPELVTFVSPVYPELAREAGIEGTVLLRVLVDTDGTVLSAGVIRSDVTPAMEEAALAAARRFIFRAAMQGANTVRAYMAVPVVFKLR